MDFQLRPGRAWVFIISVVCFLYGLGLTLQQLVGGAQPGGHGTMVQVVSGDHELTTNRRKPTETIPSAK